MAGTTSIYGFNYPTSTDLVKDGATAIQTLATNIDTMLGTALNSKTKAGSVLVKSQVIGSAVASVNVTGAFSATYSFYKIVIAGTGVGSGSGSNLLLKLGASATGYYSTGYNNTYAGVGAVLGINNDTAFRYSGIASTNYIGFNVDLVNPGTAAYTQYFGGFAAPTESSTQTGMHQVATAYTDFTITPGSGTLTGGTIYVYGYGLT